MSSKKILLSPQCGLCNRLRSIAAGLQYAREHQSSLSVYWSNNAECACWFSDLFQPIPSNILGNGCEFRIFNSNAFWHQVARKRNLYLPRLLRMFFVKRDIWNLTCDAPVDQLVAASGNTFIATCEAWCDCEDEGRIFRPTEQLQQQILSVTQRFNEYTIGIHIRRTDNAMSIQAASVSDFTQRMEREIALNPEVNFYLATDDLNAKHSLQNQFGSRIITFDVPLCRDSLDGMKGAVIDLWCLASTSRIIGSYYSSYSDFAAKIGNVALEVLKK